MRGDDTERCESEGERTAAVPDWIGEALRTPLVRKAAETVQAIAAFTRAPRRFSEEWSAGGRHAINPLLLMIASVSAMTPLTQLTDAYSGHAPRPALEAFIAGLSPFSYYAALGLVAHGVLFAMRARRPVRGSLGVALFAGAGPGVLATFALHVLGVALYQRCGTVNFLDPQVSAAVSRMGMLAVAALLSWLFVSLAFALAGANGVSLGKASLAVLVALVACGWVLEPYGHYCDFAHIAIRVHHEAQGFRFTGGFRT